MNAGKYWKADACNFKKMAPVPARDVPRIAQWSPLPAGNAWAGFPRGAESAVAMDGEGVTMYVRELPRAAAAVWVCEDPRELETMRFSRTTSYDVNTWRPFNICTDLFQRTVRGAIPGRYEVTHVAVTPDLKTLYIKTTYGNKR